jgi:predicted pyridoxine 5'-phosphate oxidase superfamily flavin-nucleotide-binding protein
MSYGFLDIAATASVRAAQAAMGSDHIWQDFKGHRQFDRFTPDEAAFIARRDSFYMATVSETGWPYIQHRGGPPGFLKVVDDKTLAFADYRGNRQYISVGNLGADDRAALILMDYAHRARLLAARVNNVDIGCMQINWRWHRGAFASPVDMLDPSLNVRYAARLLAAYKVRAGSWSAAVAQYHTRDARLAATYQCRVARALMPRGEIAGCLEREHP